MRTLLLLFVALTASACHAPGPDLASTEQLSVLTSPSTSFTFADTQVGQTSAATSIVIKPGGSGSVESYDDVTSITASCSDFVINATGLPAAVYRTVTCTQCATVQCVPQALPLCMTDEYVTYTFTASFRPNVAVPSSCVVNITTNNTTTRTITLYGTGTAPPIDIDVQPGSVAFGQVRRNTASTPANIAVRNIGGSTMTVSSVAVSGPFTITAGPTTAYTVGAGAVQGYQVTCNPTTLGALSGTFVVNSDDPATSMVSLPLSCTGIDSALDINPNPIQIPATRVGEPRTQSITLTNSGTAAMLLQNVALTGTDMQMLSAPPANTMLAPGATATAQVRFGATASGPVMGSISVGYDGQSRVGSISASALDTSMSLTPDGAVDLGAVCVGQSKDQSFTVRANAAGSFKVTSLGSPEMPFTLTGPALPATVSGGGVNAVTFMVTTAPTVTGPATSSIAVGTDIPCGTARAIELSVFGLPAGVSPTPAEIDFGTTMINSTTVGQTVQVTNCSTGAVTLANARLEGPDAADFAIVQAPTALSVAPTAQIEWLVVAQPHSSGAKTATFVVDGPDGPIASALLAEGLSEGGTDVLTGDTPSYYTCSTGSPGASGPLAIALGALLIRRSRRRQG
ncbi:hypothetical protein BH11MYX3_BH11MYX3_47380 [soil metagenome]